MKYCRIVAKSWPDEYQEHDFLISDWGVEKECIDKLRKVAAALKLKGGQWWNFEYRGENQEPIVMYKGMLTKKEIYWFNDIAPYGECGIKEIVKIEIYEKTVLEKLIDEHNNQTR